MKTARLGTMAAVVVALLIGGYSLLPLSSGSAPPKHAGHDDHDHHGDHDYKNDHGPKDAHDDHDDHRAKAAVMSDATLKAAGIELEKAGPVVLKQTMSLNGLLQANQERLAQVTPRFPGLVREVHKRIGDTVEKNELLAKVESNQSLTTYELRAPFAGVIIDRSVALGEYVSEQKPAFTVADLSTVWADFSIHRRDLKRVRVGDTVLVDPEDGDGLIEAKVSYLSPVGASDTQSGLARAVVPNVGLRLRPGLFVSGRLVLTEKPASVAIHLSALQTMDNRTVVFVRAGDAFKTREIELGQRDQERVEVLSGLEQGAVYAARNSFVIKAELAKGSAAHEH